MLLNCKYFNAYILQVLRLFFLPVLRMKKPFGIEKTPPQPAGLIPSV